MRLGPSHGAGGRSRSTRHLGSRTRGRSSHARQRAGRGASSASRTSTVSGESSPPSTRLDVDDPVAAWRSTSPGSGSVRRPLDERGLVDAPVPRPGDGSPRGPPRDRALAHRASHTSWGQELVVNLPTEEVFTTPNCALDGGHGPDDASALLVRIRGRRAAGCASRAAGSSRSARHAARSSSARSSRPTPERHDSERSRSSTSTPPSAERGLVFRNILLDENASSHIAIGAGYTDPVEGAAALDEEARLAAGINISTIHIDLMVGGPEVDVDGIGRDGSVVRILEQGHWVLQWPSACEHACGTEVDAIQDLPPQAVIRAHGCEKLAHLLERATAGCCRACASGPARASRASPRARG